MTFSGRWFYPGPVEVHPEVMAALSRPVFHHRSDAGREMLRRIQPGLQSLFRTARPVMIQTATATAFMEAAIRSGVRDRILCVVGGVFGERFADIAERCGKEVVRLRVPSGQVLEPEMLRQLIDGPPVDAVSLVHAESSTGALAPLGELIPIFRTLGDVTIIVDAVASIGATPVETDEWQPDFILTCSQKAVGLPPGLTFGSASARFLEKAAEIDDRGRYLDLVTLHQCAVDNVFTQTPSIPLIHALDVQLGRIAAEGLAAREGRHRAMREVVERWADGQKRWEILAPEGRRCDAVTVLKVPPGSQGTVLASRLSQAGGWGVATGMGADADTLLRVGHMAEVTPEQLPALLQAMDEVVRHTGGGAS